MDMSDLDEGPWLRSMADSSWWAVGSSIPKLQGNHRSALLLAWSKFTILGETAGSLARRDDWLAHGHGLLAG